jgi:outer membrane immunogenic protein
MKRLFLSTVAFAALVSAAAAADLPARTAPHAAFAPAPAFTWSGFYVGAHAGYSWSDADMKLVDVGIAILPVDVALGTLPRNVSVDRDGFTGGVQAGYNMQFGMFVAGVEADVSWMDVEGNARYSAPDLFLFPGAITNTDVKSGVEWLGTLRARGGVTVDRALFFLTGGVAVGDVNNTFSINIPTAPPPLGPYFSPKWHKGGTELGWTVGGGVEYALTHAMSIKAEYLYYDLGDVTIRGMDIPNFGSEFIDYKFKNNGNIVRGGVNVRF